MISLASESGDMLRIMKKPCRVGIVLERPFALARWWLPPSVFLRPNSACRRRSLRCSQRRHADRQPDLRGAHGCFGCLCKRFVAGLSISSQELTGRYGCCYSECSEESPSAHKGFARFFPHKLGTALGSLV